MKKIWLLVTFLLGSVALIWLNWNYINAEEIKSDVFNLIIQKNSKKLMILLIKMELLLWIL